MDYNKPGLWVVYLNGAVFWAQEEEDGYVAESRAIEALSRGVMPKVEIMHVDHTSTTPTVTKTRMPFDW